MQTRFPWVRLDRGEEEELPDEPTAGVILSNAEHTGGVF